MEIEEAIKILRCRGLKPGDASPDAVLADTAAGVLITSYQQQSEILAKAGKALLDEMQEAADWQAVSTRLVRLLHNRKLPGADAEIEQVLAGLAAAKKKPA